MSLKEQAEELGIKIDGRWSDSRIEEEIDKVLSEGENQEANNQYRIVDEKTVLAELNAQRVARTKLIREAK